MCEYSTKASVRRIPRGLSRSVYQLRPDDALKPKLNGRARCEITPDKCRFRKTTASRPASLLRPQSGSQAFFKTSELFSSNSNAGLLLGGLPDWCHEHRRSICSQSVAAYLKRRDTRKSRYNPSLRRTSVPAPEQLAWSFPVGERLNHVAKVCKFNSSRACITRSGFQPIPCDHTEIRPRRRPPEP